MEGAAICSSEAADDLVCEMMAENPSSAEEDCEVAVQSPRECDAPSVARCVEVCVGMVGLAVFVEMPALLVLGSDGRGYGPALPEPERAAVAAALRGGTVEALETGHFVDRDDPEGYVRLPGGWLGESGA